MTQRSLCRIAACIPWRNVNTSFITTSTVYIDTILLVLVLVLLMLQQQLVLVLYLCFPSLTSCFRKSSLRGSSEERRIRLALLNSSLRVFIVNLSTTRPRSWLVSKGSSIHMRCLSDPILFVHPFSACGTFWQHKSIWVEGFQLILCTWAATGENQTFEMRPPRRIETTSLTKSCPWPQ